MGRIGSATARCGSTTAGDCVSWFTTTLADARAVCIVILFGAHDLAPFGLKAVNRQAHAKLGSCVFDPEDFLP
jgi:hypothetical protein